MKNISLRRQHASRLNGARSRGPKTPEGLDRCRQAATLHGLTAHTTLLPGESADRFLQLAEAFDDYFVPQHPAEQFLLSQLVSNAWRLTRIQAFETSLIRAQAQPQPGKSVQLTAAQAWLDSRPDLLLRYEAARFRAFRQCFQDLANLPMPTAPPAETTKGPDNGPADLDTEDPGHTATDTNPCANPDPVAAKGPNHTPTEPTQAPAPAKSLPRVPTTSPPTTSRSRIPGSPSPQPHMIGGCPSRRIMTK